MGFFGGSKKDKSETSAAKSSATSSHQKKHSPQTKSHPSSQKTKSAQQSKSAVSQLKTSTKERPLLVEQQHDSDDDYVIFEHTPKTEKTQESTNQQMDVEKAGYYELEDKKCNDDQVAVIVQDKDIVPVPAQGTSKSGEVRFQPQEMKPTGTSKASSNDGSTWADTQLTLETVPSFSRPNLKNPAQLVSGYLLQWKLAAEEGPLFLRILSVAGALVMLVSTVVFVYLNVEHISFTSCLLAVTTFVLSCVTIILDGRFSAFFLNSPVGCRAKLRNLITKNFNLLRFVWGRSLLQMVTGFFHIAQMDRLTFITGAISVGIGLIGLIVGGYACHNLAKLRSSVTDNSFLWLEFSKYDTDDDGYLDPSDFARFLTNLGFDFDDLYALKTFNAIDKHYDQKISFEEFKRWWAQVQHGKRRSERMSSYEQPAYVEQDDIENAQSYSSE